MRIFWTILFISLLPMSSLASNWEQCEFQVTIDDMNSYEVGISKIKFLEGSGFAGSPGRGNCMDFVKDKSVAINRIKEGRSLLKKGKNLRLVLYEYSAMGPGGILRRINFKFQTCPKTGCEVSKKIPPVKFKPKKKKSKKK